jgi:uncharacterized membrane protein
MIRNKRHIVEVACASFMLLITTTALQAETQADPNQNLEKCYGIVKKGMNDCATATQSCAGSSIHDKQGDAFIFLQKGTCSKIVGGTLEPVSVKK